MKGLRIHPASLTPHEALLFEAGIKLGGVFHQYLGIPVTPSTAPSVARTIATAIGLQPYVVEAEVRLRPARGGPVGRGRFAYRYLTAEMLDVRVRLADGRTEVVARLAPRADLRYPLMRVERLRRGRGRPAARRSARRRGPSGRRTSPSAGSGGGRRTPRARARSSRRRGSRRTTA